MSHVPKILAFAGSTRTDSLNKKLVKIAAQAAQAAGAKVTLIDLRDYPLPLYDGDLEAREGLPAHAKKIKQLMLDHDGFLIAAPEYNSSISAVLKNTFDWASRKETPEEAPLACFAGKVVALLSASPGGLGGLRGLLVVRMLLTNIFAIVIPEQKAIPNADQAFLPDGSLKDPRQSDAVRKIAEKLVDTIRKIAPDHKPVELIR